MTSKPTKTDFEFFCSERELEDAYPEGTEYVRDGQTWISTGDVKPALPTTAFMSLPRVSFILKEDSKQKEVH